MIKRYTNRRILYFTTTTTTTSNKYTDQCLSDTGRKHAEEPFVADRDDNGSAYRMGCVSVYCA